MIFALLSSLQEMESDHYHNIPMLHDTGFSIKTDLTEVEGRTLPAPKVNISFDTYLNSISLHYIILFLPP